MLVGATSKGEAMELGITWFMSLPILLLLSLLFGYTYRHFQSRSEIIGKLAILSMTSIILVLAAYGLAYLLLATYVHDAI